MNKIPEHVAIIMDGNGRWAKKRNLPRIIGHREGMKRVKEIVESSKEFGVKILTLFAFSTENWLRPKDEVSFLMSLLKEYVKKEVKNLKKNNVKLNFIGDLSKFSDDINLMLKRAMNETSECSDLVLNIALNYGGRYDILQAVKNLIKDKVKPEDIDENLFSKYLYTKGMKDPDLLIRTSGEYRISNFLLWQVAYSEFYITETYWPDFDKMEFKKALDDYAKRERRFGKISEQIHN